MFTNNHNSDWYWADDLDYLFESEEEELNGDDFDWDIDGVKGGEVKKEDDWESDDYRRQYYDNGFEDTFAPSGYQYDDEP